MPDITPAAAAAQAYRQTYRAIVQTLVAETVAAEKACRVDDTLFNDAVYAASLEEPLDTPSSTDEDEQEYQRQIAEVRTIHINNSGLEGQIEYLLSCHADLNEGMEEIRAIITTASSINLLTKRRVGSRRP